MKKFVKTLVLSIGFLSPILLCGCGPNLDKLEGEELKNALHDKIYHTTFVSYYESASYMVGNRETKYVGIDQDPVNPEKGVITLFYTDDVYDCGPLLTAFQDGTLNKEHVWCQSRFRVYSNDPSDNDYDKIKEPTPFSDLYNIRPCYDSINTFRSNYLYAENEKIMTSTKYTEWGPFDPKYVPKSVTMATGFKDDSGNPEILSYYGNGGDESYRGEIARILFYVATRYDKLKLADSGEGDFSTYNSDTMGYLSSLLEWNETYPVTNRELWRNDVIESIQGNRNPFVDQPNYACRIWGRTNEKTKKACGLE